MGSGEGHHAAHSVVDVMEHPAPWVVAQRESTEFHNSELIANIEFNGFTSEARETEFREILAEIGLPLDNVRSVNYDHNRGTQDKRLGTWGYDTGTLTFHELTDTLSQRARLGVAVHELAHASNPTPHEDTDYTNVYGSQEARDRAAQHAADVALQSIFTNTFLDPYHAGLYKELEAGQIDIHRFIRETHAIMIEQRMSKPRHLEQVEQAQKDALARLKKDKIAYAARSLKAFGELLPFDREFIGIRDGVDQTLMDLMPQFETADELDTHIQSLIAKFPPEKTN